ncbi:MAG: hypothetical protein ACMUIL_03390 [bacterium]
MICRRYGEIKDSITGMPVIGALVKLHLDTEELQRTLSGENGFFEVIAEVDDVKIKSGQDLRITFEKEGYHRQEHHVPALEGSFSLDVSLEAEVSAPKRRIKWLPAAIGGGALLIILVGGVIAWQTLKPKSPEIISFAIDPDAIKEGQTAILSWRTRNASSVAIDPNMKDLELSGSIDVHPSNTAVYTLIVMNKKKESITATRILEVRESVLPTLTIIPDPLNPNTNQKVAFIAHITDSDYISRMEILVNGKKVEEGTGSSCRHEGGPYPPGDICYEAYAYDRAGERKLGVTEHLRITDKTSPIVKISANPSNPVTDQEVTFSAHAEDKWGVEEVAILINGREVADSIGSSCIYKGGPYSPGTIQYSANAKDRSGNRGESEVKILSITDATEPTVIISCSPQYPTTEDTVTFTAEANDQWGLNKLVILVGKDEKEHKCSGTSFMKAHIDGPFPPGEVNYRAYAVDEAGNRGESESHTVSVTDETKPLVKVTCSPQYPTTEDTVALSAEAEDNWNLKTVVIQVNGRDHSYICSDSKFQHICSIGPFPPGEVNYRAYAVDEAGNRGESESHTLAISDKTKPIVNVSYSPQNPLLGKGSKITFTAEAEDDWGIDAVEIFVEGTAEEMKVKEIRKCMFSPCTCIVEPTSSGIIKYKARAYDTSGNEGTSGDKECKVSILAPLPPPQPPIDPKKIEPLPKIIPGIADKLGLTRQIPQSKGIAPIENSSSGPPQSPGDLKTNTKSGSTFQTQPDSSKMFKSFGFKKSQSDNEGSPSKQNAVNSEGSIQPGAGTKPGTFTPVIPKEQSKVQSSGNVKSKITKKNGQQEEPGKTNKRQLPLYNRGLISPLKK